MRSFVPLSCRSEPAGGDTAVPLGIKRYFPPSRTRKGSAISQFPYGRGAGGRARVKLRIAQLTRQEPLGSLKNSHFADAKPRFLRPGGRGGTTHRSLAGVFESVTMSRVAHPRNLRFPSVSQKAPLPSSLCDDTVSPAGSVGAERCPLGTCAPIGGGRPPHRGGCRRTATGGVRDRSYPREPAGETRQSPLG